MANQLFAGFLITNTGAASANATVDLLDRNTTTPVRATTTTDANGYWAISHATEGRFDVRITKDSTVLYRKYDTSQQMTALEVQTLRIRNPAFTFDYDIVPAAIAADRILNLPLITGTDTLGALGLAQTWTAVQTFVAPVLGAATGTSFQGIIGNVTPAAGTFTALTATGTALLQGELSVFGGVDVTGKLTPNAATWSEAEFIAASGKYMTLNIGKAQATAPGTGNQLGQLNFGGGTSSANWVSSARMMSEGIGANDTALSFWTSYTFVGATRRMTIDGLGNVGIGTTTFGTSAVGALGLFNGTVPSTSPADTVQLFAVDIAAGRSSLGIRTEDAVIATAELASTHKLVVTINGTQYAIMLTTVLT